MALNAPPPYEDITGISRVVMKDNAQETLANYNGNARPGEIVVNLEVDPPTLFVGNNAGFLTQIGTGNGGGGDYSNANVAAFLPVYTGNISTNVIFANTANVNNITNEFPVNIITNGGETWQFAGNTFRGPQGGSWQDSADTIYFNSPANGYVNISAFNNGNVVSEIFMEHSFIRFFVDNGTPEKNWIMDLNGLFSVPGDIIPQSNGTASLGNATNQWGELWVAGNTVYIDSVPITVGAGNVLTVAGQPVLSNNSDATITTTGNITANYFIGNGSQLTGIVASAGSSLTNNGNAFALQSDGNVVFEGAAPGEGVNRGMVWDYGVGVGGVNSEVRQDVAGITVRAWTESGEGSYSAPVNIVTNQDSNQKTWRFDGDGNLTLPGNVNSTNISDSFSSTISNITTGESTVIVTLASEVFEGPFEGEVIISDVTGTTEANGVWGYRAVEIDQFELYTDATLTTPVDGTAWTAYISGGTAVAVESYVNLKIQGGNIAIGSNDKTWTFDTTGNVTIPGSIVGTGTITIDNSTTGNTADILLLAADDVVLRGGNKPAGADSEGGDINLFAGDGSPDDGVESAGGGGDITLLAGDGGAANIDSGGSGGFARLTGGQGGAASATATAGQGGIIEILAGDAGSNGGNVDLGNQGGTVTISAGDSTGNLDPGGDVIINSGLGGDNASPGQIEFNVPVSDAGPGGTWSFNYQGNMIFPSNGQIVMDNGDGVIGPDGDNLLISWDNEDVVIKSVNDDVRLEADDDVQIRAGYDAGYDTYLSQWEFSNSGQLTSIPIVDGNAFNDGHIQFVGNSSGDGLGYTTLRLVPDATLTGGDQYVIIDPTAPGHIHIRAGGTQDNSSADLILGGENSFVKIAAGANNYVYVRSNSNDWTFGTDGVLTLPGEGVLQSIDDTVVLSSLNTSTGNANSVYMGSGGGLGFSDQAIGGNWLEIFRNGAEPEIKVPVGRGNLNIQTAEGENSYNWTFDNTGTLTAPGNITTTGNISGGNILGNGASMTGVATQVAGSWNVTTGTNNYSFTVPVNGVYQLWVRGNIPNGIITYTATVSVTNNNVPVLGQQFAWNYEGAGNPILITSIPDQIVGTAGAISNASPSVGTTTNTFVFGISNTSGSDVTVDYGYTKLS